MKKLNLLITLLLLCSLFTRFNAQTQDSTIVWLKLDSEPEFPGGDRALNSFWENNFNPNHRRVKSNNNDAESNLRLTNKG
jgi:hypothetical protein